MPNVLLVTIVEVPPSVTSAFKSIVPIATIPHNECLARMAFQLLAFYTWSYAVNVLMQSLLNKALFFVRSCEKKKWTYINQDAIVLTTKEAKYTGK